MTVYDRPKALIVDDKPANLYAMENVLRGLNADLFTAGSGNEALALTLHHEFALILLDVQMPEMDGFEVAELLRAREATRSVPIIFVTAIDKDEQHAIKGYESGAVDYLYKPVNPDILKSKVQVFLDLYESHKALESKNQRLRELCNTAHQFVDNVSHEFRTPLTVIKEFSSIIRDRLAGEINDEQEEYLDIIANRVDDLRIMVDDMLDVSKLETGVMGLTRTTCRAADIVDRVRPTLERKAAGAHVSLSFQVDENSPLIYCDAEKIGRVIINLVVNAVKFSAEEGSVEVWTRYEPSSAEVVIGVTDHGPGIAPENVKAIFARFKQLDGGIRSSTKGFGLGLNIAKELVGINMGDIGLESEVGKGSTFYFTVPTMDPSSLMSRYLERFRQFRPDTTWVSLISLRAAACELESHLDDVNAIVQHVTRWSDMAFRRAADEWLLVMTADEKQAREVGDRIASELAEVNANRPGPALPAVTSSVLGSWNHQTDDESLKDAFASEMVEREASAAR